MADTTPLRRLSKKTGQPPALADVETNDLRKHYMLHANGFYGERQYTDLALLLRRKPIGG